MVFLAVFQQRNAAFPALRAARVKSRTAVLPKALTGYAAEAPKVPSAESSRSEETSRPSSPASDRTISPKTPELGKKNVWPSHGALTQLAGGGAGLQAVPVGHGARLDAAPATGRPAAGYKRRPHPAAPRGQSPLGGCGSSSPGHARAIASRTPPGRPRALMRASAGGLVCSRAALSSPGTIKRAFGGAAGALL